jgi:hypothetical protein
MRLYCVAIFAGLVASTGASASSFVTLPAPEKSVSPSFVYLGGDAPKAAEGSKSPTAGQSGLAALHYPAPRWESLDRPIGTGAKDDPGKAAPLNALHFPPQLPADLKAARTPTRLSASVVAMGEPGVEYSNVSAVAPKTPQKRAPDFSPLVIRGGISGHAFASGEPAAPPAEPGEAPAPREEPMQQHSPDPPAQQREAARPAPPKGMAPVKGVH